MMLTLTSKFGALVAAATLAFGLAGAAPAATVMFGALQPAVLNPLVSASSGMLIQNSPNDIAGVRFGPYSGIVPAPGVTQPYTSIGNGYAEYSFGGVFKKLSFNWGTPDKFNSIQFYLAGNPVDSVAGFGNGNNIALPFATITKIGTMGFDTVRFISTAKAFEFSNLSVAAIPVPAAGLLLVAALGGMLALRRRKTA